LQLSLPPSDCREAIGVVLLALDRPLDILVLQAR
jgi:hypothetical protein